MTAIRFVAMPSDTVSALRASKPDSNNQPPERHISDGSGLPCRHCLEDIAEGEPYLILAYRPFPHPQPYAEMGPIFLHAEACERFTENAGVPPMFLRREALLIRGYGADDRIIYGSGQVVPTAELAAKAASLLARPDIAYVHARSASNNCYQCRIDRV
jgi:hypothetical protein